MRTLIWIVAMVLGADAQAASLAGVTMPDTVQVGGAPLVLNGLGLREKYMIDVYVGGLYLPQKTTDAKAAIEQDVAKRIVMHFVYGPIEKAKLIETFDEGLAKNPNAAAFKDRMARLNAMMEDVNKGDVVTIDYVPGKGTTVTVKGKAKGTIEGADFMRAVFAIYLGDSPPTYKLKRGMMGG